MNRKSKLDPQSVSKPKVTSVEDFADQNGADNIHQQDQELLDSDKLHHFNLEHSIFSSGGERLVANVHDFVIEQEDEELDPVPSAYTCEQCPMKFVRLEDLSKHLFSHQHQVPQGQEAMTKCIVCSKLVSSRLFVSHLKIHAGVKKPHPCPSCPLTFPRFAEWRAHLSAHQFSKVKVKPSSGKNGAIQNKSIIKTKTRRKPSTVVIVKPASVPKEKQSSNLMEEKIPKIPTKRSRVVGQEAVIMHHTLSKDKQKVTKTSSVHCPICRTQAHSKNELRGHLYNFHKVKGEMEINRLLSSLFPMDYPSTMSSSSQPDFTSATTSSGSGQRSENTEFLCQTVYEQDQNEEEEEDEEKEGQQDSKNTSASASLFPSLSSNPVPVPQEFQVDSSIQGSNSGPKIRKLVLVRRKQKIIPRPESPELAVEATVDKSGAQQLTVVEPQKILEKKDQLVLPPTCRVAILRRNILS